MRVSRLAPAALLAALNLFISWRLFKVEYTNHLSSIEGAWISIARYISTHWGDFSWWPLWHCGMPYPDTYVPLLHLVVAMVATLGGISAAHAYHAVVGVAYSLGPVTLYYMAVRLGSTRGAAFLSALFYSLFSPCTLLMPDMARDAGGFWYGRRLQVLTVYGEGAHVSAITLLPIAILALEYALHRRTGRAFGCAALSLALVFLTNVPGTMATALAVFCWLSVQPSGRRRAAWIIAAGAAVFAYALACYGIPPSSLRTVFGNVGPMHEGFSASLRNTPFLLVLVLAAAAGLGYSLTRTRLPLLLRFAVLHFALTALLVLTAKSNTFELLPQVGRLHLEMEIGACLIFGTAAWYIYQRMPRWMRPIVLVLCLVPVGIQVVHYRYHAKLDTQRADLSTRSEYVSARWAGAHLPGQRFYVAGSTSFWWNAFTDNPQLIGCCDQGLSMPVLANLPYLVNIPGQAPGRAELTKAYLQALGVQAMVASGPGSTDEYKDIQSPERFETQFPVLHRELGDTIYAIPQRSSSLAHIVRPQELVSAPIQSAAVVTYAAAIEDPARPTADFEWLRNGTARIRATLSANDLISVQVAWFPGWTATDQGQPIPITSDGLGLQLLHPVRTGPVEILLRWTNRPDQFPAALISLSALATLVFLLINRRRTHSPGRVS